MSSAKRNNMIRKLAEDAVLLDEIMKWAVSQGHDKKYKKCIAGLSEQCLKVDAVDLFHGKYCSECRVTYMHGKYLERKAQKV